MLFVRELSKLDAAPVGMELLGAQQIDCALGCGKVVHRADWFIDFTCRSCYSNQA